MVRVWALEPYYGGSHRQFLDGLSRHSSHEFSLLTLPGRHWKWRMHGGALTLADQARDLVGGGGRPDVFFASDMLDLPVFLRLSTPGAGAGGAVAGRPRAHPVDRVFPREPTHLSLAAGSGARPGVRVQEPDHGSGGRHRPFQQRIPPAGIPLGRGRYSWRPCPTRYRRGCRRDRRQVEGVAPGMRPPGSRPPPVASGGGRRGRPLG